MTDPFQPLLDRGISPATLGRFGVQVSGFFWRYPIRDDAGVVRSLRLKLRPDYPGPKYAWDEHCGHAARPDLLYNAGALAPGHACLLLEGEPDVWRADSLGLRACSFLSGAGSIHPQAVRQLAAHAPSSVLVIYDRDEAGSRGAVKAVRALWDAGLHAAAVQLPATLPEHGDFTDLCAACQHDPTTILAALRGLPTLAVPREAPRERRQGAHPRSPEQQEEEDRYRAAHPIAEVIGAVLDLQPDGGGRLRGLCPFHDDHHPSLVVYAGGTDEHFHCYACSAHGDVIDFLQLWNGEKAAV